MAKIKVTKGLQGRLIGAVAGGAASAVWDKYISPSLGDTVNQYADYVKIGMGVALPAIIKNNQLVTSVSDSLIAIGADRVISGLLGGSASLEAPVTAGVDSMVGASAAPFPKFREYTKKTQTPLNVG